MRREGWQRSKTQLSSALSPAIVNGAVHLDSAAGSQTLKILGACQVLKKAGLESEESVVTRSSVEVVAAGGLVILLALACYSDIRERRIPNPLPATVLLAGLVVSVAFDPVVPGLLRSLAGVGVGLVIWLPGWLARMMGAGDVKLFAAAGGWLGPLGAVNAALIAAISGGLLAIIWMLMVRGRAASGRTLWAIVASPRTMLEARSDPSRSRELVPYSLAITAGVVAQLVFPGLVVG